MVNNWTTTGLVQDDVWTSSITSEANLVCQSTRVIASTTAGGIGFDGLSTGTLAGPFTNVWYITFEDHAYIDGSTIYPRMSFTGWYDTYTAGDPKVQDQLDPLSTFRIDGVLIPTYINWFPSWVIYDDWAITGSQSFDLDPETYWPYAD